MGRQKTRLARGARLNRFSSKLPVGTEEGPPPAICDQVAWCAHGAMQIDGAASRQFDKSMYSLIDESATLLAISLVPPQCERIQSAVRHEPRQLTELSLAYGSPSPISTNPLGVLACKHYEHRLIPHPVSNPQWHCPNLSDLSFISHPHSLGGVGYQRGSCQPGGTAIND